MSEEAGHGVGSIVMEDEYRSDGRNVIEKSGTIGTCSKILCSHDNFQVIACNEPLLLWVPNRCSYASLHWC